MTDFEARGFETAAIFRVPEEDRWHRQRIVRIAFAHINMAPEELGKFTQIAIDDVYDRFNPVLEDTTSDLAEFSRCLSQDEDFAHFTVSQDLEEELTFIRKKLPDGESVVAELMKGVGTEPHSPVQWSPIISVTAHDVLRRNNILNNIGIPPQTAAVTAARWSVTAGVCLAIAKRAFDQTSDKKDFEEECTPYIQRLTYSAGAIREKISFTFETMASIYSRSLAEGMALQIIADYLTETQIDNGSDGRLFSDELRTRSLGYLQKKYSHATEYVDLEEIAMATPFTEEEIYIFFGFKPPKQI